MSKPLTIHQLMRRAGAFRAANARYVRIVRLKTGYAPDGHAFAACMSYSTHTIRESDGLRVVNRDRQRYVTVIKFLDVDLHVLVSCSCPDFMYRWEQVLHKRGNAELEYSNGQSPDITNPGHLTGTCKHLVALYTKIKSQIQIKKA